MRLWSPPSSRGSYGWYYADFFGEGWTAVVILMVGGPFSAGYARPAPAAREGSGEGDGSPQRHSAVNLVLYGPGGRRAWALSEYRSLRASEDALVMGHSRLEVRDGRVRFDIRERSAPWGRPVEAVLELTPETPPGDPVTLVPGLSHRWQPLAARARAQLWLPTHGQTLQGAGYFDTNRGEEPLGTKLPGWEWARVHGPRHSTVRYRVPGQPLLEVSAHRGALQYERIPLTEAEAGSATPGSLTRWGLRVPRTLSAGADRLPRPRLLESSPFYARLSAHSPGSHALAEVADFRRFRSPLFRWMARFRTRVP